MKKKTAYIIFTIVYWLLATAGLVLFGLAFEKVHLNKFALKRNYYSSEIESEPYVSGLYHKGIGYYFLQFPSSKHYLRDQKLNITNGDLQKVGVTYTLVYRMRPEYIYGLYQQQAMAYESQLLASINSIVSSYFIQISQQQTRTTVQDQIVTQIRYVFDEKQSLLTKAIQIQAFWLNQLDFYQKQVQYQTAYQDSTSYSQAYEEIQILLLKTKLRVQSLKNTIQSDRQKLIWEIEERRQKSFLQARSPAESVPLTSQILISNKTNTSQIFQFYPGVILNFK